MAFRPDPKRAARIVDPKAGVEKVRREGRCRVCGRRPSGHPLDALNRAHYYPRAQGGDDVDANIAPICGSGSSGCHGELHAGNLEMASKLRKRMLPEEEAYVIARAGEWWLEAHYPKEVPFGSPAQS